ncbi:MAG: YkgJ family cysteine cluster protein [Planctomycetes bacterium]|nr:YkgJ family cysteine cluster protein [Planctomycetota bacterium]
MDVESGASAPRAEVRAEDRGLRGVVPFRFACHRCGHCCSGGEGHVWLEEGEEARLAAALGTSVTAFVERFVRRVPDPRTGELRSALREAPGGGTGDRGGPCVLLEGRNTCRAYNARPRHCAEFPYWDGVLNDRDRFEAARATCPGIAVVPDPARFQRASARLGALLAELGPARAERCCLDGGAVERVYATGLEADHALAHAPGTPPAAGCRLGEGAPVACRLGPRAAEHGEGERWLARVRAIERETDYPAAYGPLDELLATRAPRKGAP